MSKLLTFLLALAVLNVDAAINTYVLTITNTPLGAGATNIVAGSRTRYWTNATSATTIQTNLVSLEGAATNLFNAFGAFPQTGLAVRMTGAKELTFIGTDLELSVNGNWASVSTNVSVGTNLWTLMLPIGAISDPSVRLRNANAIVDYLSGASKAITTNSGAMSNFLSLGTPYSGGTQTVSGPVAFANITEATVGTIKDAYLTNIIAHTATITNLSSPGTGANSFKVGADSVASSNRTIAVGYQSMAVADYAVALANGTLASGYGSVTVGNGSRATKYGAIALGNGSMSDGGKGIAIGHFSNNAYTNSMAIGSDVSTTTTNQVKLGASYHVVSIDGTLEANYIRNSQFIGTNQFNGALSLGIRSISTLANGNNSLPAVTNALVEITTGPTGAFAIVGIPAGTSGQLLEVVNLTGQNMTVAHESGVEATAGNRIVTMTGADRATTGNGIAKLYYSASQSRWILLAFDP